MDQTVWATHVLEAYVCSYNFDEVINKLVQIISKKLPISGFFINIAKVDADYNLTVENKYSSAAIEKSMMLDELIQPNILSETWRNKIFYVSHDDLFGITRIHTNHRDLFQASRASVNFPIAHSRAGQDTIIEICFIASLKTGVDKEVRILGLDEIEFMHKFFLTISKVKICAFDWLEPQTPVDSGEAQTFSRQFRDGRYGFLNARQMQIVEFVKRGYTNHEISRALHVSVSTVKLEVSRIFQVLNISGRKDLPD
jgi:DNA-binding CsgD family transcriptional regulator